MKIKSLCLRLAAGALALAGLGAASADRPAAPGYAVLTGDAAVSAEALRAAIDPLFDPATTAGETRALLVLHDGHVLAERYAPGFGPDVRMQSWSIAKTVTALMVGIMVADGRLALDEPAPVPAWRQPGDPRAAITLRHLLQMSAGLRHFETTGEIEKTDALRMLVGPGAPDQLGYAEGKPLIHKPGAVYTYSSANSVILCGLMASLLTPSADPELRRQAMAHFLQTRLAGPVGLASLVPEYDERGTMLCGAMMHMTPRDFAKLGELLLARGKVGDRPIVSERWIDFMTTPSRGNPAYGGHVWLNRPGNPSDLFPGEASPSLFAAIGYRGQFVLVSPTQKLVVVRLGISGETELPPLRHALARLVRTIR